MSKPTIIIVPGAWQLPPAFENIVRLLQEAGYPTVHVPLPTVGGTELPLAGLSDDVDSVRKVLVPIVEEGKEVVVIGHSAGGISMSGAVEGYDAGSRRAAGKSGGVVRCIFMTAFVLPKGQSLLGMLGGQPLPWMVVEGDRVTGNPEMLPQVGLNDLSAEEQTKWAAGMTHTSAALFAAPALYEPWANGIPCSYIFHTEDNALPLAYQQGMAQLLDSKAKTETLKAGHCSFLSIPDQLVKAIESTI